MPEQTKEAKPLQENVRYWAVIDENGLMVNLFHGKPLNRFNVPDKCSLVRVTLKAVSDG